MIIAYEKPKSSTNPWQPRSADFLSFPTSENYLSHDYLWAEFCQTELRYPGLFECENRKSETVGLRAYR
jgi:hypothetical protein